MVLGAVCVKWRGFVLKGAGMRPCKVRTKVGARFGRYTFAVSMMTQHLTERNMIRNELEFYDRLERAFAYIEDIAQFVREHVRQDGSEDRLLTKTEAAEVLCCSERTIDRYREDRLIECVVIKGKVFFTRENLWNMVKANIIKSAPKTRADFEESFKRFTIRQKRNRR